MKKYITIVLILILMLMFSGCNEGVAQSVGDGNPGEAITLDTEVQEAIVDALADMYKEKIEAETEETEEYSAFDGMYFNYNRGLSADWGTPDININKEKDTFYIKHVYHNKYGDITAIKSNDLKVIDNLPRHGDGFDYFVKDGINVYVFGENEHYVTAWWEKDGNYYGINTNEQLDIANLFEYHRKIYSDLYFEDETVEEQAYYDSDILILILQDGKDYRDIKDFLDAGGFEILSGLENSNVVVIKTPYVIGGTDFFKEYEARFKTNENVLRVRMDKSKYEDEIIRLKGEIIPGVTMYMMQRYVDIFWE